MTTAIAKLRAPLVLVHGLCGFDQFSVRGRPLVEYFPGIPRLLHHVGNRVLIPRLTPTAGVRQRASELKAFLQKHLAGEPAHIIAHSMGGLDARYLASRLDTGGQVLSLTTLGTPHRGCSFADWGVPRIGRILAPLFRYLGLSTEAFSDLTTERCAAFNREVPDAPGVRYFSVAGQFEYSPYRLDLALPYNIVTRHEGPNDGIVSVASATYGEPHEVWKGDHLGMVNWPSPLWPGTATTGAEVFGSVVGRLRDEGF